MTGLRLIAHAARGKLALLLLLGLGMSAAAIAGIFLVEPAREPITAAGMWVGALFFPLCVVAIARQMFRAGPVMEIGPEGVLWRRWSDERIPWTAFTRAADLSINRQEFVSLWLRDPERYRAHSLLGRLAGANKALGFGDISLGAQGLSCSHAEILEAVRTNAPHLFT
jgi:hypothetical protein